ncbi:MAG: FmdB family zinc ribbon protein [Puniceicoccaceae bacterium]
MPTYDYRCAACGQDFEIFHSMLEPARTECPACRENQLIKQIGAGAGLIFKGSGFYETDYKRSGDGKEERKADSSGGGDSKAEGQPASKTAEAKSSEPKTEVTKEKPAVSKTETS